MRYALPLHRVHEAPESPGVYRWNWLPSLPLRARHEAEIAGQNADKDTLGRLLHDYLVAPIQRLPYQFRLMGDLLPPYEGQAHHSDALAKNLAQRLLQDGTVEVFLDAIQSSSTSLAVPLYVGETNDLRRRLLEHREAILEGTRPEHEENLDEVKIFAGEVRNRNVDEEQLVVTPIQTPVGLPPSTLEYFANRTLFPVLGRR